MRQRVGQYASLVCWPAIVLLLAEIVNRVPEFFPVGMSSHSSLLAVFAEKKRYAKHYSVGRRGDANRRETDLNPHGLECAKSHVSDVDKKIH